MNNKKAMDIIYTVCNFVDARPPGASNGLASLIERVLNIANAKCKHPWQGVKRIDHKDYGNAEYICDGCEEMVRPTSFEVVPPGNSQGEK